MSVMESIMETIAKALPDKKQDPLIAQHGYVGKPYDRVDAQAKVQGEARFTAEFKVENLAYAVPVYSTIARGKIRRINSGPAEACGGRTGRHHSPKYTAYESATDRGLP